MVPEMSWLRFGPANLVLHLPLGNDLTRRATVRPVASPGATQAPSKPLQRREKARNRRVFTPGGP